MHAVKTEYINYAYIHLGGTRFWMNLNDIAVEGQWVYAPHKPIRYTNWCPTKPRQPNGGDGQDCGCIFPKDNCWHDWHCWIRLGVMCEVKPGQK